MKTKVHDLLNCLTLSEYKHLSEETQSDWNAKKLPSKEFFQLLVYGLLHHGKCSTRVFSSCYSDVCFQHYAQVPPTKCVSHSSIADRLQQIPVAYFEGLFKKVLGKFSQEMRTETTHHLCLYDSTITSLSSKLLFFGMRNGSLKKDGEQGKKSIKFTIGFDGLPFQVAFHQEQAYVSETLALGDIITQHSLSSQDILVFDRGMQSRQKLDVCSQEGIYFVTRIKKDSRYTVVEEVDINHLGYDTDTLKLEKSKVVHLHTWNKKPTAHTFTLIEGVLKEHNEKIVFVTNLPTEVFSVADIVQIYRNRWKIEQFFRFIKQELHFKHFFSRNWNGIQVMAYCILIVAILLLVYFKRSQVKGYKIPIIQFCNQLKDEIIQEIIQNQSS
jgi:transposase